MERHDEIFAALAAPFTRDEEKRRTQGRDTFRYAKTQSYKNRLDEVLGGGNWWPEAQPALDGLGTWICKLTIRLPDGTLVTKTGVGCPGAEGSKANPAKTADTDAFKRACEQFGIGRYLAGHGIPRYARAYGNPQPPPVVFERTGGDGEVEKTKAEKLVGWANANGHWDRAVALASRNYNLHPSVLDDDQAMAVYKVLKAGTTTSPRPGPPARPPGTNENGNPVTFGWPKSGAALYAWAKNLEASFNVAIIQSIDTEFGEHSQYAWPRSYKEWTPEQVNAAALYVASFISLRPGYAGQFDDRLPRTPAVDDLTGMKGEMLEVAMGLNRAFGITESTRAQLLQTITIHAAECALKAGGETIGDFDACTDLAALGRVLGHMRQDLEEAKSFSF